MPRKSAIFSIFWLFSYIPSDFPLIFLPAFTVQPDIVENFQSCWNHLKRKWLLLLCTSCLGTRFLPHFFPLPLSFRFAPLSLDFFAPSNFFSIFSFFSPLFPLHFATSWQRTDTRVSFWTVSSRPINQHDVKDRGLARSRCVCPGLAVRPRNW